MRKQNKTAKSSKHLPGGEPSELLKPKGKPISIGDIFGPPSSHPEREPGEAQGLEETRSQAPAFKLPSSHMAIVEEWHRRWKENGDEEILNFARKHVDLAIKLDWVRNRVKELASSPQDHDRKKARAFARICGVRLDGDKT